MNRLLLNLLAISALLAQAPLPSPVNGGAGGGSGTVTPATLGNAIWCLATSGSGTTYTCTPSSTGTLAIGQIYLLGIDTTNTGNSTLNIAGQGAKAIKHKNTDQFAAGDLLAGDFIFLEYDGTQFVPVYEQLSNNPGLITPKCGTAPGSPASGFLNIYCTSDTLYYKTSSGAVISQSAGQSYRSCDIAIGDTTGSAISNGQLGPQSRVCYIPAAATIVEMDVNADAGTPNIIIGRNRAGSIVNIVSSALATAASGGIACSNTGGTTGLNGATTCSSTLQNTGLNTGDYLELVSGTAGGTAKFFVAHVIYTVN